MARRRGRGSSPKLFRGAFPTPSPFLRRRFTSQRRKDAEVRREVPAAERPTARPAVGSAGAADTEGRAVRGENRLCVSCPARLPFVPHADDPWEAREAWSSAWCWRPWRSVLPPTAGPTLGPHCTLAPPSLPLPPPSPNCQVLLLLPTCPRFCFL